jgi:hypothetical protein
MGIKLSDLNADQKRMLKAQELTRKPEPIDAATGTGGFLKEAAASVRLDHGNIQTCCEGMEKLKAFFVSYEFDLPSSKLSGHAKGRNWRPIAALTKKARESARILAMSKARPATPLTKAKIGYWFMLKTNKRTDEANLIHRCKGLIDGIVDAGVLVDDCWQVLHIGGVGVEVVKGIECDKVQITIEEWKP